MSATSNALTVEEWSRSCKVFRLLLEDHAKKLIAIEGQTEEHGEDGIKIVKSGILIMEKTPFEFDEIITLMKNDEQEFQINLINDIYHEYTVACRSACNELKLTFIYPATPLHVEKYTKKDYCLVTETCHRYERIVKPYIEKQRFGLQWVYNILDGKSEQERILLNADDFILLPGPRWDGKINDSTAFLALSKSRDICSIRDLKIEHLSLLQNILDKSTDFIESKFGIPSKKIRAFFHYPPTYYHLHVHFTSLENRFCGAEIERGRLLQDVIDHIQLQNDYYQTKTLYYKLAITDPLYKLFEDDESNTRTA